MNFEKFKEEFDADLAKMTDEDLITALELAGVKFHEVDCKICNNTGYVQPKGQNAKMFCWNCRRSKRKLNYHA